MKNVVCEEMRGVSCCDCIMYFPLWDRKDRILEAHDQILLEAIINSEVFALPCSEDNENME